MTRESTAIGLVGVGGRGRMHGRTLHALDGAQVVATCDVVEERARETANEFGADEWFVDHEEMLAEMDLDAVYASTAPNYADPIVTAALERGLHVFAEKPPGINADQTRKWAALADENGCITAVGFQRRFNPFVEKARELVLDRSDVMYGVATFHKQELGENRPDWTVGALFYDVCHAVDLLAWMGNGVEGVDGYYGQLFSPPEEYRPLDPNFYVAVVEFENGGVGILNSNRTAGGRELNFEMHGRGISVSGEIHGDVATDELVVQRDDEPYEESDRFDVDDVVEAEVPESLANAFEDPYGPLVDGTYQLNRHFLECVREDVDPRIGFDDAIGTMETAEEILMGRRLRPHIDQSGSAGTE